MAQSNKRTVRIIYGIAGSGKTRYTSRFIRSFARSIIIDGGFTNEQDFPGVRIEKYWDLHQFLKENADRVFRVRFCPTTAEFPLVCQWAKILGDLCLVIDEADRFLPPGRVPEEFKDLTARGRHYGEYAGVSIALITQNPKQIPIEVRSQSTHMVIFNTAEPAHVDWLRKCIGKEAALRCQQLPEFHFVEWIKGEPGWKEHTLDEIGA